MKANYPNQIIALWTAFLLALLFHTQLGLMPLFHGQSVANSPDSGDIAWVMWLMLAFFVPPLLAIILPTFTDSKRYRTAHFLLTVIYSFLNFAHLIADLLVTPIAWYQIALMAILVLIGIVLNIVSYRWLKHYTRDRHREDLRASIDEWLYNGGPYQLIVLHFLIGRRTTDEESIDNGYDFGQPNFTYNYLAGHSAFLGRLLIPSLASENHRAFHFWLVAIPTVGIWFAALGVSTMAFGLNGFNFNHSILDSRGEYIHTNADILNRANLGLQAMHAPNTHHFPLVLSADEFPLLE